MSVREDVESPLRIFMEIILAKHMGFCMGVKRAYGMTLDALRLGKPVYILGRLIHNAKVVAELERLGARTIQGLDDVPEGSGGCLIISSHGVPPEVVRTAEGMGLEVIDTTCPWVKKTQDLAGRLGGEGRHVLIVGDRGHPETKGILGWAGPDAELVENVAEAGRVAAGKKLGVVVQTTQSQDNFNAILGELRSKTKDIKAFNTICDATHRMKKDAEELAKRVDLMLVIGDPSSANTRRLREVCLKAGGRAEQIQGAEELREEWLKGIGRVGITAGASTPDRVVQEVVERIRALSGA